VKEADEVKEKDSNLHINCLPLTSILFALNMTNFDFLRLNSDGRELEVLRTIDFNHINIQVNYIFSFFKWAQFNQGIFKVILVNFDHRKNTGEQIKSLLMKHGYTVHRDGNSANENYYIFTRE
jgi:hypothetical protein